MRPGPTPAATTFTTADPTQWTGEQWRRFAEGPGRTPGLLTPAAIGTEAEVFGWLKDVAVAHQEGRIPADSVRIHLDLEFTEDRTRVQALLPGPDDRDLDGYVERLCRATRPARVGVILNDVQQASWSAWRRLAALCAPPYHEGLIRGSSRLTAFLGNYERTRFGVHQDPHERVIQFVVRGPKRLRFWPPEVVERVGAGRMTHTLEYQDLLAGSSQVTAQAGQAIHWPGSAYHIGEAPDRGFTLALSFVQDARFEESLHLPAMVAAGYGRAAATLAAARASRWQDLVTRPETLGATDVERCAREAIDAYSAQLTDEVLTTWARRCSALGCSRPPPLRPCELTAAAVVERPWWASVLAIPTAAGILLASNGQVLRLPAHPGISGLVALVRRGAPFSVSTAMDAFQGVEGRHELTADGVLGLCEWLAQAGALEARSP